MHKNPQGNVYIKYFRARRQLDIKRGLITLCIAILVNLAEAENNNSEFSVATNFMLPYPLTTLTNSNQPEERKDAVSKASEYKSDYCHNPACIQTASRVLKYMDTSFDPCDDFYKFACGQYFNTTVKTSDEFYIYNNFITTNEKIMQQVKNILEQASEPTEPRYVKLMKTFYQSCMNTKGDSRKDESFHWEEFYSKIRNLITLEADLFSYGVTIDPKNTSNFVLGVKQSSDLEQSSSDFHSLITKIAANLGADKDKFKTEIMRFVNTELMLNMMSVPDDDKKDNSYNRMTFKELEGNYSNILWKKYFNAVLKPYTEVRDDDVILISDSSFFEKFNKIIHQFPKRRQANYLVWNAIYSVYKKIGDKFSVSSQKDPNQWKKCYKTVKKIFKGNFGDLYSKYYFHEGYSKMYIEDMVNNILQQFKIDIQKADWLDRKTKNFALEKLESMVTKRHINHKVLDDHELDRFYTNLEITPGNFLQSFLNVSTFHSNAVASLFRKPIDEENWLFRLSPDEVNAEFNFMINSIDISPGILQGIFFNESRPHYMNYGSIGTVIGHEITHGLINEAKRYDKEEEFLADWWQPESNKQFHSKAQCFIHQYGNYTAKEIGLNVNGIRTQAENIADDGGLKAAYLAYEKWVEKNDIEPLLPGVNYTQSQLFWISFAQMYCERKSPVAQWETIENDKHSPKEFRVLGSLMNRPEFARDFQCLLGTRMNPENKCSV